jgi:3-hydroxymyristoyl/3-hydroxydecanoyl-(acyl carrier protein) dehydratase
VKFSNTADQGDKLAGFMMVNAVKTQKIATPQASNECLLAALAFLVLTLARNDTWFTLQKTSCAVVSLAVCSAYLIIFLQTGTHNW